MFRSCVKISYPRSFPSCETAITPGIRTWKRSYLGELNVRKPLVVSLSQISEELTLFNVVQNLKISNPALKAKYLQMRILAQWFVLGGWWSKFFERGSQDLSNHQDRLSTHQFFSFFTSIVYGLDRHARKGLMIKFNTSVKGKDPCHKEEICCWRICSRGRQGPSTTTFLFCGSALQKGFKFCILLLLRAK
jgi:hypothetical protein